MRHQKNSGIDRRRFLASTLAGASGLVAGSRAWASRLHIGVEGAGIVRRKLGRTGLSLPVVSMGVMRSDSPGLVRAALEKGIIHFDTAHGYQRGKNEEMLGGVFAGLRRDSYVIATKVPPEERDSRSGVLGPGSTSRAFLEKVDISLRRLKIEYVDILYVHGLQSRDAVLFPEMLEAVTAAKRAGKARFVGVSTHKNEPEVIRAAVESGVYEVVLAAVNFKQDHYQEMRAAMAEAGRAGVGIIGMKTMAGGFLDKEKTKPINCTAALKFVLQDENLCTTIPGITTFDQLSENARVNSDIVLTPEEKADLEQAALQGGLYCQGCSHCVALCPKGLPIPDLMRAFMYTYGYGNPREAREVFRENGVDANPCGDCASCGVDCASGFAVRERITDVARLVSVPEEFLG